MKKIVSIALMLSLVMPGLSFAKEDKKEEMPGMSMERPMGMFRSGMGKAQMVATDEGGVIVLMGNKLAKFDADLNLVKEVEIKMPPMGGKQCPMMGKMAAKDPAPAAPEAEEKAA